jgi:hypothetical protein
LQRLRGANWSRWWGKRTVDGNGNALGQDVTVSTLKGRDLGELVELEVLVADTLGRLGVDNVEVQAVGLCDGQQGSGTGVTLRRSQSVGGASRL